MKATTVAVLGGTGFIGRALVRRLLDDGHFVRTVSRRPRSPLAHPNLEHVRGAVSDESVVRRAVSGASVVCHLVTGGGDSWADYERDVVGGARLVGHACLDAKADRLVYASSIAALYLGGKGRIVESDGVDPQPLTRSAYSRGKIAAESVLMDLHATRGLPVVILRPGIVVGRGGPLTHSGFGLWQSSTCCIGWGAGRTPLPIVLVDDVADAFRAACTAKGIEGQAFNLAGDVRFTASEFVSLVALAARRRVAFHARPLIALQALDVAKWLLKVVARKPENPRPHFRHIRSASMRASIDASAAKSVLGWTPVADRRRVIEEAILANVDAILPGDLRHETVDSR